MKRSTLKERIAEMPDSTRVVFRYPGGEDIVPIADLRKVIVWEVIVSTSNSSVPVPLPVSTNETRLTGLFGKAKML